MPVYNPAPDWLRQAIGSVEQQIYPQWELCIADDCSTDPAVHAVLDDAVLVGVRGEAHEVLAALHDHRPDVVFNLCEAPLGSPRLEPHAAALLEWLGVRHTGSGSETLALARPIGRMVSPLSLQPRVPIEGRFIYGGVADRLVNPRDQVMRLWEHWGRPEIIWYQGAHTGFFRSRPVQDFIDAALRCSTTGPTSLSAFARRSPPPVVTGPSGSRCSPPVTPVGGEAP